MTTGSFQLSTVNYQLFTFNFQVAAVRSAGLQACKRAATPEFFDSSASASQLERDFPQSNENKSAAVDRLLDQMVRNVRTTLTLIFGVV